jgi:hypothetical protein
MPRKSGKLTPREQVFSPIMARTGDAPYSALKAGYADTSAATRLMQRPQIQAEIIKHQQQILVGELLPASTLVLAKMLDMETAGVPWNARATAAKIVRAEVAGLVDAKGNKDFADMTADEIHAAIEDARRQLAERSKPIVEHAENTESGAFE